MNKTRVLVYLNQKKKLFSIKSNGRVFEHSQSIVLTESKFSQNKSIIAGIIGVWDKCEQGYYPNPDEKLYASESIKYNLKTNRFIRDDWIDLMEDGVDSNLINDLEIDPLLDMSAVDNAGIVFLEIEENDWGDIIISGIAYHLRKLK